MHGIPAIDTTRHFMRSAATHLKTTHSAMAQAAATGLDSLATSLRGGTRTHGHLPYLVGLGVAKMTHSVVAPTLAPGCSSGPMIVPCAAALTAGAGAMVLSDNLLSATVRALDWLSQSKVMYGAAYASVIMDMPHLTAVLGGLMLVDSLVKHNTPEPCVHKVIGKAPRRRRP